MLFLGRVSTNVPARLHVLLAKDSPQALVIRRGPSRQTAVIGRNRKNDSFQVGQWLKGKLYPYRCDIAPDGRHWIYFAMDAHGQTWTAVAMPPYLKALDFYPKGDAWNGGGLFTSNRSYWLNDAGPTLHQHERRTSALSISPNWHDRPNYQGECPGIYFLRLERDGWTAMGIEQTGKRLHIARFCKRGNAHWHLHKLFHMGFPHPEGKGPYYENHRLNHSKTGDEHPLPEAEWADLDGGRLLWAEQGMVLSGRVSKNGLESREVLYNANPLCFSELVAPY